MLHTHGKILESFTTHQVTEANLAASRNHAERLQEQCQNLAREGQEANERSLVMEVSLGQVLHDCHDLAGSKEEMCAMQRDVAECWGLVGELCASIEGGGQRVDAALGAEWVVDTVDADTNVSGGIKERSREACRRVTDLYAQLINVKSANKELQEDKARLWTDFETANNRSLALEGMAHEMLHTSSRHEHQTRRLEDMAKELAQVHEESSMLAEHHLLFGVAIEGLEVAGRDLELQVAHLECVALACDASRRASDRERDNSTVQKSAGGSGERDCSDMTKDLVCRESSMLTYQIQRLRFEVGEIIADEEASQRRERELTNQVDGLVSQQQLMAVMMERIWLAVAMHAEGNQAWRYIENAMQGNPVRHVCPRATGIEGVAPTSDFMLILTADKSLEKWPA